MAAYEQYLHNSAFPRELRSLAEEVLKLRSILWLNHGHKGMYGDDGEMQCGECASEYGFWDWKRTDIDEIQSKILKANMEKSFKNPIKLK